VVFQPLAKASACADWASMRMPRVSSPLSTTQALNGARVMPPLLSTGKNLGDHLLTGTQGARHDTALAIQKLGARVHDDVGTQLHRPLQCGGAKQLSTASKAPAVVRNVRQGCDVTHFGQRVGRCLGKQQFGVRPHGRRHASTSVCDTKLDCTPNLARSEPMSLMVDPNMDCEHTTWSPDCSKPMHIIRMADMPDAVDMAASVPSMRSQPHAQNCSPWGCPAAVGKALLIAGKAARRGLRRGLHITTGQVQRLGVFAVLATINGRTNGQRIRMQALG
jgi:hypothetical protein